jgi:hypothetical protein
VQLRLNARIGAFIREPDTIQIPVPVADAAYGPLNAVVEDEPVTTDDIEQLEALANALHWGFLGYGVLGGDINAPWLVRARRLRRRILTTCSTLLHFRTNPTNRRSP